MALHPTCEIKFEGLAPIKYANAIRIKTHWNTLSDTCEIALPNFKGKAEGYFEAGRSVQVKLGYDGNHNVEFEGYVSEVMPRVPFVLKCEDEFYTLKRSGQITESWEEISLKSLLRELLPSADLHKSIPSVTLENFQVRSATRAQVLEELKDKYGLAVYFKGRKLFVGLPFSDNSRAQKLVRYHFQKNVVDSTNLTYKRAEDVRLKAKAVSLLRDNTRIEVEVGDADGEQRTLFFQNIKSESALKEIARAELKKYKFEGYRGDFKAFGLPFVEHSQTAQLEDGNYPNRPVGQYFVAGVDTDFSYDNGFKRTIKPGIKL